MTTPRAKIERIQRLSAEERLVQPTPEDWLKTQDEQQRTKAGLSDRAAEYANLDPNRSEARL